MNNWWASTLAENITGCEMISWFNCSSQSFETYIVGGPSQFDFQILDGYGYFILVNQSSSISISGYQITDAYVPLCDGWNGIGWYKVYDTKASYLAENITNCNMVSWFNCSSQSFETYIVGGPQEFDFPITQGMGVFVLIDSYKYLDKLNLFPDLPEFKEMNDYELSVVRKIEGR